LQTPAFFALAKNLRTLAVFPEIVAALDSLDDHLSFRTFLVGHQVSAADWAVWGSLKGSLKIKSHDSCIYFPQRKHQGFGTS